MKNEPMTWWREGKEIYWTDENGVVNETNVDHWMIGDEMYHLCKISKYNESGVVYKWKPRKPNPVACPRCRYRFDNPYMVVKKE
jgi:hypothetical protein